MNANHVAYAALFFGVVRLELNGAYDLFFVLVVRVSVLNCDDDSLLHLVGDDFPD